MFSETLEDRIRLLRPSVYPHSLEVIGRPLGFLEGEILEGTLRRPRRLAGDFFCEKMTLLKSLEIVQENKQKKSAGSMERPRPARALDSELFL